jgi:hypothetical protein
MIFPGGIKSDAFRREFQANLGTIRTVVATAIDPQGDAHALFHVAT